MKSGESRTSVDGVDGGTEDEEGAQPCGLVDPIQTQGHVVQDGEGVLSPIDQMREDVTRVVVPSKALKQTPDAGKGREEAEKLRVG